MNPIWLVALLVAAGIAAGIGDKSEFSITIETATRTIVATDCDDTAFSFEPGPSLISGRVAGRCGKVDETPHAYVQVEAESETVVGINGTYGFSTCRLVRVSRLYESDGYYPTRIALACADENAAPARARRTRKSK